MAEPPMDGGMCIKRNAVGGEIARDRSPMITEEVLRRENTQETYRRMVKNRRVPGINGMGREGIKKRTADGVIVAAALGMTGSYSALSFSKCQLSIP